MTAAPPPGLQAWLRAQPKFVRELEAGGLAGGLAKTCVAPLERTKILFQTHRVPAEMGVTGTLRFLWQSEGLAGLFKGNAASVLRIVPYAAIHFSVYEHYRRFIVGRLARSSGHVQDADAARQLQQRASSSGRPAAEEGAAGGGQHGTRHQPPASRPLPPAAVAAVASRPPEHRRAAAVAALQQEAMADGSPLGSSIDFTAAVAAAEAQADLEAQHHHKQQQQQQRLQQHGGLGQGPGHGQGAQGAGHAGRAASLEEEHAPPSVPALEPGPVAAPAPPTRAPGPLHPGWDLVAGSLSGATAVMLTYPLDLVRTRLAYKTEGGFAISSPSISTGAGAGATSAHIASTSASTGAASTPSRAAAPSPAPTPSTSGAGTTSTSSTGHAAMKSPRLRHGIYRMLQGTLQAEGVRGLYQGVSPTLLGILPYAGLKFYVYQSLKHSYKLSPEGGPGASEAGAGGRGAKGGSGAGRLPIPIMLLFGGVAGLVAQTVTYPLDVVRRRMQVEGLGAAVGGAPAAALVRHTTLSVTRAIVAEDGMMGLFRGLSVNYIKVVPSTAIGFTIYDFLKQYLDVQGNL